MKFYASINMSTFDLMIPGPEERKNRNKFAHRGMTRLFLISPPPTCVPNVFIASADVECIDYFRGIIITNLFAM